MRNDLTFVFSKSAEVPERFFQGYCFQGADYMEAESGARRFLSCRGGEILPGQDGCYVSMKKEGGEYHFSTDYAGNKKIFYFWSPSFWVVSNSFVSVVESLKANRIPVHVNAAHLRAVGTGGRSSVLNQLTSYSTSVAGIFLAPALSVLSIGSRGVRLGAVPRTASPSYQEALSEFCRVWVGRIGTLSSAGIALNSDLTGGADSRAVLSLILGANREAGASLENTVFRSGRFGDDTTDLDIATEICNEIGLPLNVQNGARRPRLSAHESYDAWRALCLGAYHPIYFPRYAMGSAVVSFGGGGAENHRRFYKHSTFNELIERCVSKLDDGRCSATFAADMKASIELIDVLQGGGLDPLIRHYRNFRHRFHTGRSAQHAIVFSPLGSSYLERASEVAGEERIRLGQVGYDIMWTFAPELLDVRFDREEKILTPERKRMLTPIKMERNCDVGAAFVGEEGRYGSVTSGGAGQPLELLYEEVKDSARSQVVNSFWGRRFVQEVVKTVGSALERGRFGHAVDGQNASALVLSGTIL